MRKGTSLYLDLVRFLAALSVVLDHVGFLQPAVVGPFWKFHFQHYGQTAVDVFFVLSGYVIAHVLATREQTALEFSASRFGRLYSVVVPALLLTLASNFLVGLKDADFGHPTDYSNGGMRALSYFGTLLLLNRYWAWPLVEAPNAGTFWSLSAEAAYYLAIGLFVFARGPVRLLSLLVLSALAGPFILALAPIWVAVYCTYQFTKRRQMPARLGAALWLATAIALPFCFLLARIPGDLALSYLPDASLKALLIRYIEGLCFALNIVSLDAFSGQLMRFADPFTRAIRWLGSLTFALYLFHVPLLQFFGVYGVGEADNVRHALWMLGGTFVVTATVGRICERSKVSYKRWFLSMCKHAALRGRDQQDPAARQRA